MEKWDDATKDTICFVENNEGPTLGYSKDSGITIIEVDGFAFKDLNKNGKLDKYEDWRLQSHERAKDLASKMTLEQIAGLMLYSSHQMIPAMSNMFGVITYGGKEFSESGANPWDLNDQQLNFLKQDHLRHILLTLFKDTKTAVKWNNNIQAFVEGLDLGIPANNSSDPRHGIDNSKEFNLGGGVSQWPDQLGLAATFDPELVRKFGEIAANEYRALGITTALSPQVDLATDPRWGRFSGTFGEDTRLVTDLSKAYCEGFQTTLGAKDGWGKDSVNAMVKHWPGGGSGEGGRDAHFNYGKYGVYPGDNFEEHLKPFTEGAFNLSGGTKQASAVMPYYTISYGVDKKYGENVGNSFSKYLITDLLRGKHHYDGVVCTDWHITADEGPKVKTFSGKCWGVESLSVAQRHYKVIMAGVDQFGGNNDLKPVLEAYEIGVKDHGQAFMRDRFEQSAVRLLKNMFRVGLFENPYLNVEESQLIVEHKNYITAGFEAQLKSLVMLKNKNGVLPLKKGIKLYIPKRYTPEFTNWFGHTSLEKTGPATDLKVFSEYFTLTDAKEADAAIVIVRGPMNVLMTGGYDENDLESGSNGYVPISLSYKPYIAKGARKISLAGGDLLESFTNRSYKNKKVQVRNADDLDKILQAKKFMGDKPVIVIMQLDNPAVVGEFEGLVDGLFIDFGVTAKALCEILIGGNETTGLLPMQMPADMETVEEQEEDVAHDMRCHMDSEGNVYDFGFGLNYNGPIEDRRVEKYVHNN